MGTADDGGLRGLDLVRVSKVKILKALRENREEHRAAFEDALDGWHEQVQAALKEQLKRVREDKRHNPQWYLPMPQDHTRDYDHAIELLEYSLDEEFELSAREFAQFVRDDWGWKGDFVTSVNTYSASAGGSYTGRK
jgi:hypothetical protein